ncbi:enoyl-CoA hydratase/isomerase family protein [Mangrovimonas futianensis]|uniref:enoyl-CoA hydratase/isomerase family protein n=1 Tax=Mangrovimonas futianensis TaxID=2895523 RepID=UPI001E3C8D1D|nr:enoyl-CoA hydratase/isomerase family protein [Mangrovimonas futianensis]MCF1422519.1 enoyl-CoA hydratase/isomerase family protein [Mangrovimonas futianensis]
MSNPYVNFSVSEHVGTIEFYHPSHNSLPSDLLKKLQNAILDADKDPGVKVIVLKSGGDRTFCAGASFDELKQIQTPEEGLAFFSGFANVINAMRRCSKFILVRAQGKAVGGGVGILAAADYCVATQHASIKLSELSIGIGPFVIAPAIERKIGVGALSQLSMDCKNFYSAEWCLGKGLYSECFEDVKDMDHTLEKLAKSLSSYHTDAMASMKRALWSGTEHWDNLLIERAKTSGELVLSETTKNFLNKF